ncbi:MAG TPA: DUF2723 domain-containing protein, partial [Candidatus Kapabacteria bacterium]|nr:DUF2723 domain-containing protein [Candidatus Kapabacteria bacterium]
MSTRTANRIIAGGIFLISLTQFSITAQAGVAFWESGVFAAAAGALQVSHPFGSPLYLLVGRVFHVILYTFFSGYQAWHITMVSVVASALTVMLLYLVLVNIIRIWRENIETKTDTVITYGAAAIGALSLSFSDAFWHNATESTPYASALLCSAIALWLITQWYHRADEPGSMRYILLTAYVIGLSAGVHPLALLVIFPVAAIIYFRARSITIKKLFTLSAASALYFIIGASVCITILLRSDSQPSINNSPVKGSIDLRSSLPSNIAPVSQHLLSDKGHAFFRYLCWQYIGRAGDVENALAGFTMAVIPDAAKDTKQWWYGSSYDAIFPVRFWGIPFLVGLFGIFWHFKKDWRTGLALLIGFVALGLGADFFRSTQMQSRETDYLYTEGFFIYSLWVGIGAYGILELIEEKLQERATMQVSSLAGAFVLLAVAIDLNTGYGNWEMHDRSNDYLPWDYAYNTLQSCGKDAILFTSGENDTYPLWYLQNAENIRRDVRIINLPMQNKFEKQENDSTGSRLKQGEAQIVTLPVPHDTMAHYTDDPTLLLHPSIRFTYAPDMTADLNGKPGQYFSEKEQVVFDIVKTNAGDGWKRPICWANTCSPDEYAGLGDYVRSSGLVATLVPVASRPRNGMDAVDRRAVEQNLMHEPERIYEFPHNGFLFRNLNDPHIYRDETHRQILSLYRQAFLTLAMHYVYDEKPEP